MTSLCAFDTTPVEDMDIEYVEKEIGEEYARELKSLLREEGNCQYLIDDLMEDVRDVLGSFATCNGKEGKRRMMRVSECNEKLIELSAIGRRIRRPRQRMATESTDFSISSASTKKIRGGHSGSRSRTNSSFSSKNISSVSQKNNRGHSWNSRDSSSYEQARMARLQARTKALRVCDQRMCAKPKTKLLESSARRLVKQMPKCFPSPAYWHNSYQLSTLTEEDIDRQHRREKIENALTSSLGADIISFFAGEKSHDLDLQSNLQQNDEERQQQEEEDREYYIPDHRRNRREFWSQDTDDRPIVLDDDPVYDLIRKHEPYKPLYHRSKVGSSSSILAIKGEKEDMPRPPLPSQRSTAKGQRETVSRPAFPSLTSTARGHREVVSRPAMPSHGSSTAAVHRETVSRPAMPSQCSTAAVIDPSDSIFAPTTAVTRRTSPLDPDGVLYDFEYGFQRV